MVLSNINWEELKLKILKQESFVNEYGDVCKEISIGKVSNLTPSGKPFDLRFVGFDSVTS